MYEDKAQIIKGLSENKKVWVQLVEVIWSKKRIQRNLDAGFVYLT